MTTTVTTLREADAARYIALSPAFLRKARATNRGPAFVRVGRAVVHRITDLDQWLDRHRIHTKESQG
jgi:hypothetical protein